MKLPWPFLQLPVRFDADLLAREIAGLGEDVWRPHPNGLPGNDALTLVTVDGDPESDELWGPMAPTPHLLACPYLMQAMAAIGATWGRSRLMRLSGQAEVTPHVDTNYYWAERMRVHVPVVTQPTVRFLCGDQEINMGAGECWIFDTWRLHRVLNDDHRARIHLVADTVGGEGLWNLMQNGRPHDRPAAGWTPRLVGFDPAAPRPELDYEHENAPEVMTPWEIERHLTFVMNEADPSHPAMGPTAHALQKFVFGWKALWSRYGAQAAGRARYQALLDAVKSDLARAGADKIRLRNGVLLVTSMNMLVLGMALRPEREARPAGPLPVLTPESMRDAQARHG